MPQIPTRDDIRNLSIQRGKYCVSIYLPTNHKGVESLQGATRIKNLVRQAERKLADLGIPEKEYCRQIDAARSLANTFNFTQPQDQGLALFIAPDGSLNKFRLPIPVPEDVRVNGRYYLKPLMQLFTVSQRFYILALSRRAVRLFKATKYSIEEVNLPAGVPRSLDEAMKYEDWSPGHHMSAGSQGRGAGGMQEFSGHGADASDKEDAKADLVLFFQMVDKGIREVTRGETRPMILAGLEYLHPLYKEANTYQHLIADACLVRAVDDLKPDEIRQLAYECIKPHFDAKVMGELDRFGELHAKGLASNRLEEVVKAASTGRVDSLLVSTDAHCWGMFNEQSQKVQLAKDEKSADGEDLVDYTAVQTLLTGGMIYTVPPEQVPDNAPLAAVFRY